MGKCSGTNGHPNIFHLARLVQELVSLALVLVVPIACDAVVAERALHVLCREILNVIRSFGTPKVPACGRGSGVAQGSEGMG